VIPEPTLYQLRFVDSEGKPVRHASPSKRAARLKAKEFIESGEALELVVLDDAGRFIWFARGRQTRVEFLDEWPIDREWKDVVGVYIETRKDAEA
jgi:hypothetical protein